MRRRREERLNTAFTLSEKRGWKKKCIVYCSTSNRESGWWGSGYGAHGRGYSFCLSAQCGWVKGEIYGKKGKGSLYTCTVWLI